MAENEEEINPVAATTTEPVSKVKWIFIGIILGIFVWGIIECCRYLFDGSVKTSGEVQKLTHLPVIGRYQDGITGKKGIDLVIARLQSKVIGRGDSLAYIGSLINAMDQGNCLISSQSAFAETRQIAEKIREYCSEMQMGEYSSGSVNSLNIARNAGKEIIVVSTGKTRRSDLERELEVCSMQNIKISGLIVVENL